jgi:hypothetical protein
LTGGSDTTWQDEKTKTYWPVDLLSHDIPGARILTFGYDADVTKILGPISQSSLRDHASALLSDLAASRQEPDSVRFFLSNHLPWLTETFRKIGR